MNQLGKAGGLSDVITDFEDARKIAFYVADNWRSESCLPIVELEGYAFFQREHILNSLLMIYRRPFVHGQRFKIPDEWVIDALGNLAALHRDALIARANNVIAHSIDACSSTTATFSGGAVRYCSVRPGHNKYDFDNLVAVFDRWIPFLRSRLAELEDQILSNPPPNDHQPSEVFMAPFGCAA